MKIVRGILGLIGVFLIYIFVLPLFLNCSLNIGTITGIGLGFVILLYSVFFKTINAVIQGLWKKKTGKVFLSAMIAFVFCGLLVVSIESYLIISAVNNSPKENTNIIILGCRVYGDRPSRILTDRMDAAIDYLEDNPGAYVIVSGGKGSDEAISEAECMYRYLTKNGIDEEKIIVEDKSTSTKENFEFSKKLMEEKGLPMELAVATSDFHEYRASVIANSYDIKVYSVPAKTRKVLLPTYYVRELYGILYDYIRAH